MAQTPRGGSSSRLASPGLGVAWAPHVCRAGCRPSSTMRLTRGPGGGRADLGAEAKRLLLWPGLNVGEGMLGTEAEDQRLQSPR